MSTAIDETAVLEGGPAVFTFQPWKMKEIRRLYINLTDGTKVGYLDLATLEKVPESAATSALLADALAELTGSTQPAAQVEAAAARPVKPLLPWHDLAGNRPGQRIEALDDASYRAGVAGEQRTAGVLAGLERQGYRVLHSLPLSARKDLDHLVIGPAGIFAINTKATTYEVTVKAGGVYADGYRQNWNESIERDASVVAEMLSVAARMELACEPLVSVWSAAGVRSPGGAIAAGESLQDIILGRPPLYPPEWVDVVFNIARRSDTWSLQGSGRH